MNTISVPPGLRRASRPSSAQRPELQQNAHSGAPSTEGQVEEDAAGAHDARSGEIIFFFDDWADLVSLRLSLWSVTLDLSSFETGDKKNVVGFGCAGPSGEERAGRVQFEPGMATRERKKVDRRKSKG